MIYAMSDIHGCIEELKEQMEQVDLGGDNRIVFLGDYIDYGPCSGQVLRYVYELQKEYGEEKVITLKGNHEAMLLEWIDEFNKKVTPLMEAMAYDSWLKTDAEHHYNAFRTLVTEEQMNRIIEIEKSSSFAKLNSEAAGMVVETNGDLIKWIRSMPNFYETADQIFVHAGVDEEAEDFWKWGTGEDIFYGSSPQKQVSFLRP